MYISVPIVATRFLSTLSVRRATLCSQLTEQRFFISIHALREESDDFSSKYNPVSEISIHALREESDSKSV